MAEEQAPSEPAAAMGAPTGQDRAAMLTEVFKAVDVDTDGAITLDEFAMMFDGDGDVDDEIKASFGSVDVDNDGAEARARRAVGPALMLGMDCQRRPLCGTMAWTPEALARRSQLRWRSRGVAMPTSCACC